MQSQLEETITSALDEPAGKLPHDDVGFGEILGFAARKYLSSAPRALAYLTAGSLPGGAQRWLEDRTGGWYNAQRAVLTNAKANIALYSIAGAFGGWTLMGPGASPSDRRLALVIGGLCGLLYGGLEHDIRKGEAQKGNPLATLPVSLALLPVHLARGLLIAGEAVYHAAEKKWESLRDEALRARKE